MGSLTLLALLPLLRATGAWAQGCGYRPEYDGLAGFSMGGACIVGGTQAPAGKWPWVVSVQTSTFHFCGGSIIHLWWVLSAAHCFTDERKTVKVAAGSTLLGRHNVTHWVRKIHVHPLYNTKTYDNDIALLLLEEPIPYSWYHSALCLPDRTIVPDDNLWQSCFVAGWGLTHPDIKQGSYELLDVEVGMVDWMLCLRWLHSITRNMVCAGYEEGGRDACQGDSGGPLMCQPPSSSPQKCWYQVGIVSWGRSCAATKSPGVYTHVSNYHSWMEQTAAHEGNPFRVPQTPHTPVHGAMGQTEVAEGDMWANVGTGGGQRAALSLLLWGLVGGLALALVWS